jgi:hypothetical protein
MRLHASLEAPKTRLKAEEGLAEWLARLIARAGTVRPARPPVDDRDDRALRVARDYLADHADRNTGLDELADATGVGKFRLIRLVRQRRCRRPRQAVSW